MFVVFLPSEIYSGECVDVIMCVLVFASVVSEFNYLPFYEISGVRQVSGKAIGK